MPIRHRPPAQSDSSDSSDDMGREPRRGRRAGGLLVRVLLVTALGGALVYSGWIAKREWAAERIETVARGLVGGVGPQDASVRLDRWLALCAADCPARGTEAAAAAKAALAARAKGAGRAQLYEEALTLTRTALKRNPISAEGWARLAMIRSEQADGRLTPEVADALRTSYSAAPFSRGAAVWRISFCASHWHGLDSGLRRHAVDELVWLSSIDRSLADAVVERVGNPAAKFAFELAVSIPRD